MPFLFNPCNPCCQSTSDAYLAYVPYGNGHIILAGTPSVLGGSFGSPLNNGHFWISAKGLKGFGDIGTTQVYVPGPFSFQPLSFMVCARPTVFNIQAAADLSPLGMLYTGAIRDSVGSSYFFTLPPEAMWPDVAAWVAAGGVLVLVGRAPILLNPHDLEQLNAFLRAMNVSARFSNQTIFPQNTPPVPDLPDGIYNFGGLVQDHFLTDGVCGIFYGGVNKFFGQIIFSSEGTGTILNATPLAKVGTVLGWEFTCDGVYAYGCEEILLSKTLYSSGYNEEQCVLNYAIPTDQSGGGFWTGFVTVQEEFGPATYFQTVRPPSSHGGNWSWLINRGAIDVFFSYDPAGPPPSDWGRAVLMPDSCAPYHLNFTIYIRPHLWFGDPPPPEVKEIEITS